MWILKTTPPLVLALLCGALHSSFGQTPATEREATLIAVLTSDAPFPAKADACRDLAHCGTAAAVPSLAALLADEKLAHLARYGLETIPSPAVDEVLRSSLDKLKDRPLLGLIASIGVRRDARAVDALADLLKNSDSNVQEASAQALGMISTAEAAVALSKALAGASATNRIAFCDGLLHCAESFAAQGNNDAAIAIHDSLRNLPQAPPQILAAAWRGAILVRGKDGLPLLLLALRSSDPGLATAGLRIAVEMKDSGASKALAGELATAPAGRQIQLCQVLGARSDAAALPALLTLAQAGETSARVAAIQAATAIGNAEAAATLAGLLSDPDGNVAQAASAGLAGLPGAEVNAFIIRSLDSPDVTLKLKMIEMVRQRRILPAMPVLLKTIDEQNEVTAAAVVNCYAELAGEPELAFLIERLEKTTRAGEINSIERALGVICGAASDPKACVAQLVAALPKAGPAAQTALLRTLRVTGGDDALKAVRNAVDDTNKDIHTAAIRVLGEWKTPNAAPVLLELAQNSAAPVDKILSLRGYLGMAARNDVPAQVKLEICRQSARLIQRDDEKLLLLGALANLADPASLDLIVGFLDDPAVKREAVVTVMAIAEKRAENPQLEMTRTALEKVAKVSTDNPAVLARAQELLKKSATAR